jgi:ABC-type transport system involved in multi-copper enzyme maturation permease subunit
MVGNSALQRTREQDWHRGFANLFGKENRAWWGTRRWLVQTVVWAIVVNGMLAAVMFGLPVLLQVDPAAAAAFDPVAEGIKVLFQLGMTAIALGAILIAHDQILGERQSGVTEWILSKPVSRTAYILSKMSADAIGVVVILVAVQAAIAYGLIAVANGGRLPLAPFLAAAGGMALHTLFYVGLTLMLGVLANNRGVLLGVPMAVALGGMFFSTFLGKAVLFTPWSLGAVVLPAIVLQFPLPMPAWLPISVTAILSAIFVAVALVRFERQEF